LLAKAKDYYDLNSTFGKPESKTGRVSNYGDYFPVWEKSKLVEKQATFLVAPYHRWMNREYGDQNYIRRLVFEYGTEGELLRARVIELISGTLSLRQLAERHEAVIDQYLIGNPSDGVGIVWSDVNMNELEGMAEIGYEVGISSDSNASARLADAPIGEELEKTMDLHNNQVGRNIGQIANESNVVSLVLQALYNGELVVLDQLDQNNEIVLGLSEVVSSDILCN
ncbi:hypothetical protein MM213_20640, partial [Belliella sp. R4-6]